MMTNPTADVTALDGKTLALLLCGETDEGEDDWAVFPGVARIRDGALYLERSGDQPDVEILPEWHARIRPTNESVRQILQGAEYFVALSVGSKSEDEDGVYLPTGLRWPKT